MLKKLVPSNCVEVGLFVLVLVVTVFANFLKILNLKFDKIENVKKCRSANLLTALVRAELEFS